MQKEIESGDAQIHCAFWNFLRLVKVAVLTRFRYPYNYYTIIMFLFVITLKA